MPETFLKPWGRFKAGDAPDALVLADRLRMETLRKDGYLGDSEPGPDSDLEETVPPNRKKARA